MAYWPPLAKALNSRTQSSFGMIFAISKKVILARPGIKENSLFKKKYTKNLGGGKNPKSFFY